MNPEIDSNPRDYAGQEGIEKETSSLEVEFKEPSIPPQRFWLLSVGVCLGLFLSMIDTSIVATSLYQIARDFDVVVAVNWVALAYTLAYLGCSIVFSRISDVIGRREAFMAAYLLFLVFSIACGFAQNLKQLIAFRALQGVGGSGLYSLTMIILPELSPPALRTRIATMIGMVVAMAGVLGPVVGGILTKYASWRWVFWINGPFGLVSMILFFFCWPQPQHLPTIERRSWKEVDYLGSLLTISSATLVVFAFQDAGETGRWAQAVFIAPLVVGVCGWVSLIAWQLVIHHLYSNRIMPAFPVNVFRNRAYSTAVFSTLLLGFPYLLLIYTVPMRIQVIGGKSSVIAGVILLPMLGAAAIGTITAGKVNAVKNYIFETLFVGSSFMLLGCGLLTTLSNSLDTAKLLGFLVFVGFGFGLTICASTMLSTIEVPIRDFAPAQGIMSQLRILGGSLGIAMSTAHLHHKTQGQKPTPDSYADAFRMDIRIATIVCSVAVVATLGSCRRKRQNISQQRQDRVDEETRRRRGQV